LKVVLRAPGAQEQLASLLRSMPAAIAAYKGIPPQFSRAVF